MEIASINRETSISATTQHKKNKQPIFKSLGAIGANAAGSLMQMIERQGFLVSFLIQDGLGMTFPRVVTGLYRDKEETGKYNKKEAKEVFLREVLTGPYMMSVAPAVLFLAGKYCKSTNTNTRLIKALSENLKNMIKEPYFDNSLRKDANKFAKEFERYNIEKFYKETLPNDSKSKENIEYLLKEFERYRVGTSKEQDEALANMTKRINDTMLESSTSLDELYSWKITTEGKQKYFKVADVMSAIKNYEHDVIYNNKDFSALDEQSIENVKNNLATKRLMLTVTNIAATLGGLSLIPKIYARSDVAPGAVHLVEAQKAKAEQNNNLKPADEKQDEKQVAFKAKGINNGGILSKIGAFLTRYVPDWVNREFEYNGHNFTPTLMASLALFGLLFPRGLRAYNRAIVDENGNKDMSEVNEILVRDSISSLSVVYTVPILTKCLVNSYENKQGFILTNRASMNKDKFHKFLDVINPYSDLKVLEPSELEALYGNIDSKQKMINLCRYISEKNGDLEKILSKSQNASLVFNEKTFTLDSIKSLSKEEKNEKILNLIKNLDDKNANELVKKLMKDSEKVGQSTILKIARGLNSIPGAIVTCIVSPIILGVLIPMLTYSNTRKAHAKMSEGKLQTNA